MHDKMKKKEKKYNHPPNNRQAGHHRVWNATCQATATSPVLAARRQSEWRVATASMCQACC
jgi:hypothetical protein